RAEPGREPLGVPAAEQARPAGLARLRRDRRHLLRRLELARGGARPARLDHPPRVGQSGQQLGPLVLDAIRALQVAGGTAAIGLADGRASLPETALERPAEVWMAAYDAHHQVAVERGENA